MRKDPYWFGPLDPDSELHWDEKLDTDPNAFHNTGYNACFFVYFLFVIKETAIQQNSKYQK